MTEQEFRQYLQEALDNYSWEAEEAGENKISSIRSFEDVGLLTSDEGLQIRMATGEVFQLTIQRTR